MQEQRFRSRYPVEPEEKVPEHGQRLAIAEQIRRAIAFLYGVCGGRAVRLTCDASGRLTGAPGSDGTSNLPILTDGTGKPLVVLAGDTHSAGTPVNVDTEFSLLDMAEVDAGAGDDNYVEAVLTHEALCMDIFVWDNPVTIKHKPAGGSYGDEYEIPADTAYPIPCKVGAISVKNTGGGNDGRWQTIGYYAT